MAFIPDFDSGDVIITLAIFGVQHETLTPCKIDAIQALWESLNGSADRVDYLQNEQQQGAVREGVWREILTVPKSRFTGSASDDTPWGLSAVLGRKTTLDIDYWGVFRKRMSEVSDQYTSPGDTFTSPFVTKTARPRAKEDREVIDLEGPSSNIVRLGRVKVSKVPDNLFFLHEGQRKLKSSKGEIRSWMDRVQPLFESYKDHIATRRNKNGVVAYEAYITKKNERPSIKQHKQKHPNQVAPIDPRVYIEDLETDHIIETNQLIYWLDMAHFELSGRAFHAHVKLRNNTMALISPSGDGYNDKNASLYVEMCVLKSRDVEAEYIGCREGTGLMIFED